MENLNFAFLKKIINEFVVSEKLYFGILHNITELGHKIFKNVRSKKLKLIHPNILAVFRNIISIQGVSETLLERIEKFIELSTSESHISDCFLNFPAMFAVYSNYLPFYQESMKEMKMERQHNKAFDLYVSKQEKKTKGILESFLITISERPTIYENFIKSILQHINNQISEKAKLMTILRT